jgi:DNA-binding response OmpR family regulator
MTDTKILIIDGDSNVTEVLKSYFENEGYDVKIATDGMEGLNYFKIFSPDLVLLDVILPKKDGWQVCREIREISSKPIIMVTSKSDALTRFLVWNLVPMTL